MIQQLERMEPRAVAAAADNSLAQAARALAYVALLVGLGLLSAPYAMAQVDLIPSGADGTVKIAGAQNGDDMAKRLELERGKSVVLKPSFAVKRVAVGDPNIADFVMHGAKEVQLVAKSVGNTNVILWDRSGRIQASIEVHVGAVQAQIIREIQRVLGNDDISVDMAGESVVLRGSVASLAESEQAVMVASAFFSKKDTNDSDASGTANADTTENEPQVINMLQIGANQQVQIEVKIAEISRQVKKNLGANFRVFENGSSTTTTLFSFLDSVTTPAAGGLAAVNTVSNRVTLAGELLKSDIRVNLFLEALQKEGLAKILAEPTLVARSGEMANFLAGGQIPIPVVQGSAGVNNVTIVFKDFGVNVEFTPTVLSSNRIHMLIAPEVSEPDFVNLATQVGGTRVPGFRTRRASTGVELADGQTFAIAGLLREDITSMATKIPGLGELPVLGALFRSQQFEKNQTELMLIVTPHLVQPLGPGDVQLPTDHYIEPTDFEFYMLGRLEGRYPAKDATDPMISNATTTAPVSEAGGLIGDFGYRIPVPAPKGDE